MFRYTIIYAIFLSLAFTGTTMASAAEPTPMSVLQDQDKDKSARAKKRPKGNSYRQNNREQDAMKAMRDENLMPYPKIKKSIEKKMDGKIVHQQLLRLSRSGWVYQLRIMLKNGRIKYVEVDAKTGRILLTR